MKTLRLQLRYRWKRTWLGFLLILFSMSVLLLLLGDHQMQAFRFVIQQSVVTTLYDTSAWVFLILPFLFLCFFTVFFLYKAQREYQKGKQRWALLPDSHGFRLLGDGLFLFMCLGLLYIIAHLILYGTYLNLRDIFLHQNLPLPYQYLNWKQFLSFGAIHTMAYDTLSTLHTLGLMLGLTGLALHVLASQIEEISWPLGLWYVSILMLGIVCILPTNTYRGIQTITLYIINIGLYGDSFIKQRRKHHAKD